MLSLTSSDLSEHVLPGTLVPTSLQPTSSLALGVPAIQSVMSVLQSHSPAELCSLHEADPLLHDHFLHFWRRQTKARSEERRQHPTPVLTLLKQCDRLVEREGILYRQGFRSDGGERYLQFLLPATLKEETLIQFHQGHGHQGALLLAGDVCRHQAVGPVLRAVSGCERFGVGAA